jgi:hypothetical protein
METAKSRLERGMIALNILPALMLSSLVLAAPIHASRVLVDPIAVPSYQAQPTQVLQASKFTPQQQLFAIVPATPRSLSSPLLLGYANDLGLYIPSDMTLTLADTIPEAADLSPSVTEGVYFGDSKTIFIKNNETVKGLKNMLAYEYMHYVWNNLATPDQKTAILSESDILIFTNAKFKSDMVDFLGTNIQPNVQDDERDSNMCTRLPASALSDMANNFCNNFIPNRSSIL